MMKREFEGWKKLKAEGQDLKLLIKTSDDGKYRAVYDDEKYTLSCGEDILKIEEVRPGEADETVTLFVPGGATLTDMDVSIEVGFLKIWDIQTDRLKASIHTGHIGLDNVVCGNMDLFVASGDIMGDRVLAGSGWLSLSNGLLKFKGLDIKKDLNAQVCDGTLKLALSKETAGNCRVMGIIENGLREVEREIAECSGEIPLKLKVVNGRLRVKEQK